MKKIIIGVLVITVIGAAGAALAYNAFNQETAQASTNPDPLVNGQTSNTSDQVALGQNEAAVQGEPLAEGLEGEPWEGVGNIVALDEYGFEFSTANGESVYIELGPPDYWQTQDLELTEGQMVMVAGSINEGLVHATSVTFSDGQVLALRTETGQPMWSGGVSNSRGQNGGGGDSDQTPDPKASVDEWVTLEGTLMSFQGGNMTMSASDGTLISFQTGQPRFFAEQGITFQVGDVVSVLGFYEGEQFMAGEITQTATGLRVMLRDPNGRPLWAGPGSGNGNGGNGNGGNGRGGSNHENNGPQG
ncbi:hypothetical protein ACFLXI_08360 [Chloroflexota bacterium]